MGYCRHGYFVSKACFLPPLVPVVYYPASVAYHPVSTTYPISATLCINMRPSALQNRQSSHPDCPVHHHPTVHYPMTHTVSVAFTPLHPSPFCLHPPPVY